MEIGTVKKKMYNVLSAKLRRAGQRMINDYIRYIPNALSHIRLVLNDHCPLSAAALFSCAPLGPRVFYAPLHVRSSSFSGNRILVLTVLADDGDPSSSCTRPSSILDLLFSSSTPSLLLSLSLSPVSACTAPLHRGESDCSPVVGAKLGGAISPPLHSPPPPLAAPASPNFPSRPRSPGCVVRGSVGESLSGGVGGTEPSDRALAFAAASAYKVPGGASKCSVDAAPELAMPVCDSWRARIGGVGGSGIDGGPLGGGWNGVDSLRRCQARAPSAASGSAAAAGVVGLARALWLLLLSLWKPKSKSAADTVVGVCGGRPPRHCTAELVAEGGVRGTGGSGGLGMAGAARTSPMSTSYRASRSDVEEGDLSRECRPEVWRPPDSSAGVVGMRSLLLVATLMCLASSSLCPRPLFLCPFFVSIALGIGRREDRFPCDLSDFVDTPRVSASCFCFFRL